MEVQDDETERFLSYLRDRYEHYNTHVLLANSDKHLLVNLNTAIPILDIAKTIIWEDPNLLPPDESLIKWTIDNGFATGHADTRKDLLSEVSAQIAELRG